MSFQHCAELVGSMLHWLQNATKPVILFLTMQADDSSYRISGFPVAINSTEFETYVLILKKVKNQIKSIISDRKISPEFIHNFIVLSVFENLTKVMHNNCQLHQSALCFREDVKKEAVQ